MYFVLSLQLQWVTISLKEKSSEISEKQSKKDEQLGATSKDESNMSLSSPSLKESPPLASAFARLPLTQGPIATSPPAKTSSQTSTTPPSTYHQGSAQLMIQCSKLDI